MHLFLCLTLNSVASGFFLNGIYLAGETYIPSVRYGSLADYLTRIPGFPLPVSAIGQKRTIKQKLIHSATLLILFLHGRQTALWVFEMTNKLGHQTIV